MSNPINDDIAAGSRASSHIPQRKYVALIGDIIGSRKLKRRDVAQEQFLELMMHLNTVYINSISSLFIVTAGDEFQGLLHDPSVIPDIVWDIENKFEFADVKLGFGLGHLNTALQKDAIGMDGPVWHRARAAIEDAAFHKWLGGVFVGWPGDDTTILNSFALMLQFHRSHLTAKQLEIFSMLRQSLSRAQIAEKMAIDRSVVNRQVRNAGWNAYSLGELAWRVVLKRSMQEAKYDRLSRTD